MSKSTTLTANETAHSQARTRFLANVGSNIGYTVLNSGLMLWYIPFLVHGLGVAAYGMIPLAYSMVAFASLLTNSLNVSVGRFMAIDLHRGRPHDANRTFNAALALAFATSAALLAPIIGVTYFFPVLFHVPPGLELATQALFFSVGATTVLALIGGSFGVSSIILSRFDLRNLVRGLMLLCRVGIVVFCFLYWEPSLWHIASGLIIAAGVGLAGDMLVWRRLTPNLNIDYHCVDRQRLRELIGISLWTTIGQLGFLLLMETDVILVNAMFGAETTGRYGSLLVFPLLLDTLAETMLTVLSPMVLGRYAVNDIEGVRRVVLTSTKLLSVGLALPIGLIVGFARPLLTVWLGPDFGALDVLLSILIAHQTVNLAMRPLSYVVTAYNKVRAQALVTIGLGGLNIILAVIFVWCGFGVVGIAASAAVVWTLRNVVFMSGYVAFLLHLPWFAFYKRLIGGVLGLIGVVVACTYVTQHWRPQGWLELGLAAASVGAIYGAIAYTLILNNADRKSLWRVIRR
jgi:membrane protein EpsK